MKSTLLAVALIAYSVRRDANTITPVTCPAYEGGILRNMFGKENVTEGEVVGSVEVDPAAEYGRMGAKYGAGKVAKFYGDDDGERLSELVVKAAEKLAKETPKAEKAPALTKAEKAEKAPAPDKAPAA